MLKKQHEVDSLSKRERQIMDILYTTGEASAAEVRDRLTAPPTYSAVRSTLRILSDKGHLQYRQVGPRYVYMPRVTADTAKRSALRHVMETFFRGSAEQVVATLMDESASELTGDECDRLSALIETARERND